MRISIIIPVYNVKDYIIRCLDSVIHQSYRGEMECLLIDDRGNDESITLVKQYLSNYQGGIDFKVLEHDHNRGLSAARNTGIEAATGDFLFFMDSDDEITQDCLSSMAEQVHLHPAVEIVQGYTLSIPDRDYYHIEWLKESSYVDDNHWVRRKYFKTLEALPCNAWNKLIRTSFLKQNHLYFKEGLVYEDQLWMFHVATVLRKIAFVGEGTYLHYTTPNSIMAANDYMGEKSNRHWATIMKEILPRIEGDCSLQQTSRYLFNPFILRIHRKSFPTFRFGWRFLQLLLKHGQYRLAYHLTKYVLLCYVKDRSKADYLKTYLKDSIVALQEP